MPDPSGRPIDGRDIRFLLTFLGGVLSFLLLAYLLAVGGVFFHWTIGAVALLTLITTGYVTWRQTLRPSRELLAVIMAAAGIALALSVFFAGTPTVFTGRDQGSYATAALHLAEHGRTTVASPVSSAFFSFYGPGKALNFPGFAYDAQGALSPQFPLGYIVWSAVFVLFFGLGGFAVGNGVAFFLGLVSFWALLRSSVRGRWAVLGTMVLAVSFPVVWFGRFTLSETLAWPVFTILSLALARFLVTRSRLTYGIAWIAALTLALTRIEGWALLVITGAILLFSPSGRDFRARENDIRWLVVPIVSTAVLAVLTLWSDFAFFRSLAGTLYRDWLAPAATETAQNIPAYRELWSVLWLYGMAPILIIGLMSGVILWKRRDFPALVPFALALPTFVYLVDAHISGDHPWLLRRFVFSVWPALLFSATVAIVRIGGFLKERPTTRVIGTFFVPAFLGFFFLSQLSVTTVFLPYRENAGLIAQTGDLAKMFAPDDLVLVDRMASGDPWTLIAGPLESVFGKNAAYFFNPDDIARLPLDRFDRTLLLVGTDQAFAYLERFGDHLRIVDAYRLSTGRFEALDRSVARFPDWQTGDTYGFVMEYVP